MLSLANEPQERERTVNETTMQLPDKAKFCQTQVNFFFFKKKKKKKLYFKFLINI
jgi:hypothetical protein